MGNEGLFAAAQNHPYDDFGEFQGVSHEPSVIVTAN
jgi:hypothetical protein